jgi:hypothetical protein
VDAFLAAEIGVGEAERRRLRVLLVE